MAQVPPSSLRPGDLLSGWWQILAGRVPLLSIEITRECPLSCPGCYAYGDTHLSGGVTLRDLNDFRDDKLVEGVIGLCKKHRPLQVSLVGGEPLMRRRELDRILPELSAMGIASMVVTSGVIPIPEQWDSIPRVRVAVSVDGLPEHHDIRRKPATYERILRNIAGRKINVHWVITKPMLMRPTYLEEYVAFWNAREEVDHIWLSLYTPQIGEQSPEMLSAEDRAYLAEALPPLRMPYPKLLLTEGIGRTFVDPPANPSQCLFSKMSINYSADLKSRVEPCVFGGTPDCKQCGCAMSSALHWIKTIKVAGPVTIDHLVRGSMAIGTAVSRISSKGEKPDRWTGSQGPEDALVQISS